MKYPCDNSRQKFQDCGIEIAQGRATGIDIDLMALSFTHTIGVGYSWTDTGCVECAQNDHCDSTRFLAEWDANSPDLSSHNRPSIATTGELNLICTLHPTDEDRGDLGYTGGDDWVLKAGIPIYQGRNDAGNQMGNGKCVMSCSSNNDCILRTSNTTAWQGSCNNRQCTWSEMFHGEA